MPGDFQIFISHHSSDETLALLLKDFLETIFLNAHVFVSGTDLAGGELWIKEIRDKLKSASVIVSIITPYSVTSSWVLFESGAGFVDSKCIPLCTDGITIKGLKPPLNLLQARTYSIEGIKQLTKDIAKLAELRSPQKYPEIEVLINNAKKFVSLRKSSQKNIIKNNTYSIDDKKDKRFELKVKKFEEEIENTIIDALMKASELYKIPDMNELKKIEIPELTEIAKCYNIPTPMEAQLTHIMLVVERLQEDASEWKKINAEKSLENGYKQLEQFRKRMIK